MLGERLDVSEQCGLSPSLLSPLLKKLGLNEVVELVCFLSKL